MHASSTQPTWKRNRPAALGADDESALLTAARSGDRRAAGAVVDAHMGLVYAVARRVTARPCEDAIAEGVLGLLIAIERFDHDRGVRFSTYAAYWIRARVQGFVLANRGIVGSPSTRAARRVFAQLGRARRLLATRSGEPRIEEIAEAIGVETGDVEAVLSALAPRDVHVGSDRASGEYEPASSAPNPEEDLELCELVDARTRMIREVLDTLPVRDRRVVEARALADDALTLDELAQELHVSRERVRQLEVRALRRIGEALD